jgi:hypothetical protein
MEIQAMPLEIDYRVSDQLSRSVEGDVPSALHFKKLDTLAAQKLGRSDEVLSLGCAAEGDYRWVLDEEEHILRERARNTVARDVPLKLERFLIGNPSQRNSP